MPSYSFFEHCFGEAERDHGSAEQGSLVASVLKQVQGEVYLASMTQINRRGFIDPQDGLKRR